MIDSKLKDDLFICECNKVKKTFNWHGNLYEIKNNLFFKE